MAHRSEYHFAGPVLGPLALVIGLPSVCYLLIYGCNQQVSLLLNKKALSFLEPPKKFHKAIDGLLSSLGATLTIPKPCTLHRGMWQSLQGCLTLYGGLKSPGWPSDGNFWSWQAVGVYLAYLGLQILLHVVLPGKRDKGVPLRDGKRLEYKFTGMNLRYHRFKSLSGRFVYRRQSFYATLLCVPKCFFLLFSKCPNQPLDFIH